MGQDDQALTEGITALRERRFEDAEQRLGEALDQRARAETYLLRAAARRRLDRRAEARDDLLSAAAATDASASHAERAATQLAKLGAIDGMVEVLAGATEPRSRRLLATLLLTSGRYAEGLARMRALVADHPAEALTLARWLAGIGDPDAAFDALASLPSSPAVDRLRAQVLAERGRLDEAVASLTESTSDDPEERLADARLLRRCGAFDRAEASLRALLDEHPHLLGAWQTRAELASWRADPTATERCADALPHDDATKHRLLGIARALEGSPAEALAAFDQALALDPNEAEALLWRGELRRAAGDLEGSLRDLDAGMTASHGYPVAGHLSRLLTVCASHAADGRDPSGTHPDAFAELVTLLRPLLDAPIAALTPDNLATLEQLLRRMAGNRSPRASYVEDGQLRPFDLPIHTRFLARQIQDRLVTRSPEEVVAELERLAEERPEEPTIPCHVGEIHLWTGEVEAADRAFRRAIADTEEVRWAYVGLCAVEMLRGRYDEALAWRDRAEEVFPPLGRTMYAYVGEAERRRGDLHAARRALTHMLELTPNRLSSWINLALVDHAEGRGASLAPVLARLRRRASGLVQDACLEQGLDPLDELGPERLPPLFEHMLTMMRGNRSSSFVSYFTAAGQLRFVPR